MTDVQAVMAALVALYAIHKGRKLWFRCGGLSGGTVPTVAKKKRQGKKKKGGKKVVVKKTSPLAPVNLVVQSKVELPVGNEKPTGNTASN